MKQFKNIQSWLLFVVMCLSIGFVLTGCDSNPGGLTDEQKLQGSRNARNQQMSQQAGNAPTSRDSLPGANNGQ